MRLLNSPWRYRWWWPLIFGCGALGTAFTPFDWFFVRTTFPVLSLGALWVWWSDREAIQPRDWLVVFLCYVFGWSMEWLGVKTGLVFGAYHYGPWLGPRWQGVPPLIGLNWVILVWAVRGWLPSKTKGGMEAWLRDLLGGVLVMGMDLLIEPGATRLGFWVWDQKPAMQGWVGSLVVAPLQNYLAWWVIAFLMLRGMAWGGVTGSRASLHRAAGFYALWMMVYFLILILGLVAFRP
ncbi:MAG: carotenoid biosynthesis protein [Cytophagia bacterium]|nr:carotenoid biosynthesis protein [Cytophagia bacterium]